MSLGKFLYKISLLAFLGVIVYALFFSGFLSINQVNISGLKELDRENILKVVNSRIQGKYLGFLDKNNLLLVISGSIKKELLLGFSKIEGVSIRKKFPNTLFVDIKERESTLIFCQKENCYIVDENGIAYSKKDFSLPEVREERLLTLIDTSEKSAFLWEQVFEKKQLDYILGIGEKMKSNLNIEMKNTYETPSRVSSDIRAVTSEEWKVYFNENISLQKEIDMLRVVLLEKIGDKRQNLEYVDLRSDNKVYYKFKEGTQEEANKDEIVQPAEDQKVEEKKEKKKNK